MTFSVTPFRATGLLCLALVLSGCEPAGPGQSEEEKEPHFLTGKSRVSSMDYSGAVQAFEKALEINPRSAAAHFELGWLYDQKEADPAAAIYHYEQYLKWRPNEANAGLVKQRVLSCKQSLAQTVTLGPVTEKVQRDLEVLTTENKRLGEENTRLREDLEKWSAYARSLQALTNRPAPAAPAPAQPIDTAARLPAPAAVATAPDPARAALPRAAETGVRRTHTVASGETLSVIARRYGVRLDALTVANPGVNPRRLRVGQTLVIPSP